MRPTRIERFILNSSALKNFKKEERTFIDETVEFRDDESFENIVIELMHEAYKEKDLENLNFIFNNLPSRTKKKVYRFYKESEELINTYKDFEERLNRDHIYNVKQDFEKLPYNERELLRGDFDGLIGNKKKEFMQDWRFFLQTVKGILSPLKRKHTREFIRRKNLDSFSLDFLDKEVRTKILYEAKQYRNRLMNF